MHIYKIVERVAQKSCVAGVHPHKFRATFLTRLLQSACDIANVQALAGHKSIKTTQRYLGVLDRAAARGGQSLEVSRSQSSREESNLDWLTAF